jgi:phage/plasmid-associated DNA primase
MLGHKYVVDIKDGNYTWFEFITSNDDHKHGEIYKWREQKTPDTIMKFIPNQVATAITNILLYIKKKKEDPENEALIKYWTLVEKTLKKSRNSLGDDRFQSHVIKQCWYRFRTGHIGFAQELDKEKNVIGVANGVLVIGRETTHIKHFHEYKISKYMNVNYKPFNCKDERVSELLGILHDIFPEEDVFLFIMCYFATGLDHKTVANMALFLFGAGSNGKSFALQMIGNTLGQYLKILKMSLYTSPLETPEKANSARMQLEGKTLAYAEESDKECTLNIQAFKTMVSPGKQTGRNLYENDKTFEGTAQQILAMNHNLIVNTTDHGTWRRIKYYKHHIKFTVNPNGINERKANSKYIKEYVNDEQYQEAMLSILTHYYEIYMKEFDGDLDKIPCPTIDKMTEEFRDSQDSINRFINTVLHKTDSDGDVLSITSIAMKYQDWAPKFMTGGKTMTTIAAISLFENSKIGNKFKTVDGIKTLYGYTILDKL